MHSEKNFIVKKNNPWMVILKVILSIAILFWVAYKLEVWKIAETLKDVRLIYLIPALLCFVLSKVLSSFRLNYFFRDITLHLSERDNLRLYWLGMLYNIILPGGIGGDGYKTWYLHKYYSVNWKRVVKAILLDRVAGLLMLLVLAGILTITLYFHWLLQVTVLMLTTVSVYVVVIYRYFPRFFNSIQPTLVLSVLVQVAQLSSVFFILYALDVKSGYLYYFLLFLLSSVATLIPFTVGGAGMRELVFLYCASWFSIDMYTGVSTVFIFYLLSVLGSLPAVFQWFQSYKAVPHTKI